MGGKDRFWYAVFLGFLVTVLFAIVTVNLMDFLPVFGGLAGGITAGYFSEKNYWEGAKAGLTAGTIGMFAVLLDYVLKTGLLRNTVPAVPGTLGVYFVLLAVIIYYPILAFIGGAMGGAARGVLKAP